MSDATDATKGTPTAELLAATGFSRATVFAWVRRGLLAPPLVVTDPGGRGRHAVWPAGTVERVRQIKDLLSRGYRLDRIARMPHVVALCCETCRYYRPQHCHCHPPTKPQGWPIVRPDDWCGAYFPQPIPVTFRGAALSSDSTTIVVDPLPRAGWVGYE